MISLICGQFLNAWIVSKTVDTNTNYLFKAAGYVGCPAEENPPQELEIAYSGNDIGGEENGHILIKVDAKCESIVKNSGRHDYIAWICTASRVTQ